MINRKFYLDNIYEKDGDLHEPYIYIETKYRKDSARRGYYITTGIAETVTTKEGFKYNVYSFTIGKGTPTQQTFVLKEVGRANKRAEKEADDKAEEYIPMVIEKYSMGRKVIKII